MMPIADVGDILLDDSTQRPEQLWYLVVGKEGGVLTAILYDKEDGELYPDETTMLENCVHPREIPSEVMDVFRDYAIAQSKQWQEIANKLGAKWDRLDITY